jgi:short-subunit dehydrogenase
MQKAFKDKVIWITGASSGIGEALAYAFSDADAYLILSSRKAESLEAVKADCKHPDKICILPLDVTHYKTIPAIAEKAIQFQGHLDILINNAGISQRALAQDTQLEVDQKIMDVNFFGSIAVSKAVLPHFLARKSGHIVVMNSVMGILGVPYRSAYCASKHALKGFFDTLRAEVHASNIQVTNILPGYVRTNVTINALKGDGSPNDEMAESTAGGYSPTYFAQKVQRAIARKKKEVYIAKTEILGIYIMRFFPNLFFRIIRNHRLH